VIYVASPYSSPIVGAPLLRFQKVRRFTIHLINQGQVPFSPIVYCHEMCAAGGIRTDAGTWFEFNSNMLRIAEAMFVYCLPGWQDSKGVRIELQQPKAVRIPVAYFDEEFNLLTDAPDNDELQTPKKS
jgi:hypothetical protein